MFEILLSLQIALSDAEMGAAPLPQCGVEGEDTQRCSREGEQGIPGGALNGAVDVAASDCAKGSRDCFPEDRVGNRGSGRVALALWAAGYWA
jgi:hypothetical protein